MDNKSDKYDSVNQPGWKTLEPGVFYHEDSGTYATNLEARDRIKEKLDTSNKKSGAKVFGGVGAGLGAYLGLSNPKSKISHLGTNKYPKRAGVLTAATGAVGAGMD